MYNQPSECPLPPIRKKQGQKIRPHKSKPTLLSILAYVQDIEDQSGVSLRPYTSTENEQTKTRVLKY